jgi:hypothetical protein
VVPGSHTTLTPADTSIGPLVRVESPGPALLAGLSMEALLARASGQGPLAALGHLPDPSAGATSQQQLQDSQQHQQAPADGGQPDADQVHGQQLTSEPTAAAEKLVPLSMSGDPGSLEHTSMHEDEVTLEQLVAMAGSGWPTREGMTLQHAQLAAAVLNSGVLTGQAAPAATGTQVPTCANMRPLPVIIILHATGR